jgi:hypothetical protein
MGLPEEGGAVGTDAHEAEETAEFYRGFAGQEARGRSRLYEQLTRGVSDDPDVVSLLVQLPRPLRQPNLLLGVVRFKFGTVAGYPEFRDLVIENWDEVSAEILVRRTQTNEPARCATLLPVLVSLPQPLALIEVGASAGLCLLPDRYRYDYGSDPIGPAESPVMLRCEAGTAPPERLPEIAWRAGIDIAPIDVTDESATAWLEALVWPGEGDRLERLRAALAVAREDPPPLFRRDIRDGIGDVVRSAPEGTTVVVFHTAVLAYLPREARAAFAAEVSGLPAVWLSNEGPRVLPEIAAKVGEEAMSAHPGDFVLARDGEPVAWTDPHGTFFRPF